VIAVLFLRTLSQALQAWTPIALSLTWFERTGEIGTASAIRRGLIISVPATPVASWLFQHSTRRALDEALLAAMTVAVTAIFAWRVWHHTAPFNVVRVTNRNRASRWAVTTLAALIVLRQTMEMGSVLAAAIDLELVVPAAAVLGALTVGGGAAWAARRILMRLPSRELFASMQMFAVIFFVQGVIYAFHEFTEARVLPGSDVLHTATEAYGPDGIYGVHLSNLLVIGPLGAAAITWVRSRALFGERLRWAPQPRLAVAVLLLAIASLSLIGRQRAESSPHRDDSIASEAEIVAMRRRPHVLFRDMTRNARAGAVPHAGLLSMAPLDAPESRRLVTPLRCERVSFAAGHGLCLHTEPGIFPRYTAAVLDGALRPLATIALEGRPSRTRTRADGRVGAVTVFVFGENYAAPFSTRTTLVDMSSGDVIGELEQFSTWRDGARFRAVDFNFWGVTFASDANTFYATLRTSGSTYLVRGDLALRRLTVLRDNVECPSLSPDNRTIAFKKRVGSRSDEWRLAVLNLETMAERLIAAETRRIDDQVEWLDSAHVLYAVPGGTPSITDVWVAPIDGGTPARLFLPQAESPVVVR
jgi:hypothetical protein